MLARGHTILPATHTRTIPASNLQLQSITAHWPVLIAPTTEGWPGWVDLGGWLYTEIGFLHLEYMKLLMMCTKSINNYLYQFPHNSFSSHRPTFSVSSFIHPPPTTHTASDRTPQQTLLSYLTMAEATRPRLCPVNRLLAVFAVAWRSPVSTSEDSKDRLFN